MTVRLGRSSHFSLFTDWASGQSGGHSPTPTPTPTAAEVDSSETSLFGHWDTWVPEVSVAASGGRLWRRRCFPPILSPAAGRNISRWSSPRLADASGVRGAKAFWSGTVNRDDPERWSIRPGMVFASGCRTSPAGRVFHRCARPARGDRATGMHAAVVVEDLRVDDGPVHAVRGVSFPVPAALDMASV